MPYILNKSIAVQNALRKIELTRVPTLKSEGRSTVREIPIWKAEIKKTANRYHLAGAWVAVIFNFVFSAADYVNFPDLWAQFFKVRLVVSTVVFVGILLHKRFRWNVEWVIFIPFLLISIENAYMWSHMDDVMVQKHTLSYIALFVGAGMLVVWEMKFSIVIIAITFLANIFFFYSNSFLDLTTLMSSGGVLTLSVAFFSIVLIQTRYNLNKKATIAKLALMDSNKQLAIQTEVVKEKSKAIIESIEYAQNIQEAILPRIDDMRLCFSDLSVLFLPKDIVSGDFYWFKSFGDISIVAAVDCTGHGVPGAFMSMIGNTLMNKIIVDEENFDPAMILNKLRMETIQALGQGAGKSNDSMDMSLVAVHHKRKKLFFAGANNPLILVRGGKVETIKGNKFPIGVHYKMEDEPFTSHSLEYNDGDSMYLISDGFPDQFGGAKDKKFMMKRFQSLLLSISNESMCRQKNILRNQFNEWKGNQSQIDDVLVVGIRF